MNPVTHASRMDTNQESSVVSHTGILHVARLTLARVDGLYDIQGCGTNGASMSPLFALHLIGLQLH